MKFDSTVGNMQLLQKINRLKVLDCIRQKGLVARPEIIRVTGLSSSSVTNIVAALLERNIVLEVGLVDSREVGRKATLLKLNPTALNIIAVDIEDLKINIALTDLDGGIVKIKEMPFDKLMKDFEILNMIKKEIFSLLKENEKNSGTRIAGIGVAVSGLTEDDERVVISSSLKWRGIFIKEYFENSFHIPTYVQNNSKTKAISELRQKKEGLERNIIFLDLSIGIGIINFFDQKINEAVIGEFGHTSVKKDGPLCFCGNHGCLELMCSVEAVVDQCSELLQQGKGVVLKEIIMKNKRPLDYKIILEAYAKGDEGVYEVLKGCGEYLGMGIATIVNIFNPQRIIINSNVLLSSEFIYKTAIEEANKRAYERFTQNLKYEKVNIDTRQSVKGVSLYVADKLFELSGPEL